MKMERQGGGGESEEIEKIKDKQGWFALEKKQKGQKEETL